MKKYQEAHYRSIVKALSWRIVATLTTILIVFGFTGKLILSIGVGVVEIVLKLLIYYIHERIWLKFHLGRRKHPLSDIPLKEALKNEDIKTIKDKLKELGYIE